MNLETRPLDAARLSARRWNLGPQGERLQLVGGSGRAASWSRLLNLTPQPG
jgi:hypothetical protein